MAKNGMTYAGSGVDYGAMDPFKIKAQRAAAATAENIRILHGGVFQEFTPSRGESAYLIERRNRDEYIAHVEEGLGTKNRVADAMYELTGRSYYDRVAQCTVAMIVNDIITVGASPLSVNMHLAVGTSDWFDDAKRYEDLISGWAHACNLARCAWGGGETPTLKGIVEPGMALLSGSAVGIVYGKKRLIHMDKIAHGDAIILIESSGIHANGLSLARKIADNLVEDGGAGYLTKMPDGRTYGETLLDPTHIYVGLVERCLDVGVDIHYAVNITGHGWRKLMRATRPFSYIVDTLPPQLPIFDFIQEHGPVDDREAYGNFNMGAGFALYVSEAQAHEVLAVAKNLGFHALVAGHIEKGEQKVVIKSRQFYFSADTLALR